MLRVSVITVCYNAADTIESTILSVLNQSYSNIQYIIIDGNSTDHTMVIINKYANKISKVVSESDDRSPIIRSEDNLINVFTGKIQGVYFVEDFVKNILNT
jgi:glycosyltransferase involved in cell wall biosynthesis